MAPRHTILLGQGTSPTDVFKRLARLIWPLLMAAVLINAVASICYTSMPFIFAKMVDGLVTYQGEGIPLFWPIFIAAIGLVYGIFNRLGDVFVNRCAREAARILLKSLHDHVASYGVAFTQSSQSGRLTLKMTQIVQSVRGLINLVLGTIVWAGTGLIVLLIQLQSMDWRLTALLLVWIVLCLITTFILFPHIKNRSVSAADYNSQLGAGLVDWFGNMPLVKLFRGERYETDKNDNITDKTVSAFYKVRVTSIRLNIWIQFYYYLLKLGAVGIIILAWQEGSMSVAEMVAVYPMLRLAIGQLWNEFITNAATISEHIGQIQDGLATLMIADDRQESNMLPPLANPSGAILLSGISFTYPDTRKPVLDQFSLAIEAGQKVGLIGASGAGKSTLAHILMGLYQPQIGEITIGDQVLKGKDCPAIRQAISFVPQDTSLFHRSLMDNIRYGDLDADDDAVMAAAKQAYAHDFIMALPQGYHTMVGERGVKLSGGQRQRIAIARAILKNAPVLILDEATSALDSESEMVIQQSFLSLMKGKTVIAIAHRLSTIAHMDRLIVMQDGRIIEDGTHADLLKKKGVYAALWNKQTSGFLGNYFT